MNSFFKSASRQWRLLVLVTTALLLVSLQFRTTFFHKKNSEKAASLVIMKLPRSGSSWFLDTINKVPFVFISKEIIQDSDRTSLSSQLINDHLHSALIEPKGKFAARDNYFPDGRFIEDYIFHRKWKSSLKVLGFSINPEHIKGLVSWNKIFQGVDHALWIRYVRFNVIKGAVSGYFGERLHEECGVSNLRKTDSAQVPCNVTMSLNWTVSSFISHVNELNNRYNRFFDILDGDTSLSEIPSTTVVYEELQLYPTRVIENLLEALDVPADQIREGIVNLNLVEDAWIKRTPEDLSQVLLHYDEIYQFLSTSPHCDCFLSQLTAKQPVVVQPCWQWRIEANQCVERAHK